MRFSFIFFVCLFISTCFASKLNQIDQQITNITNQHYFADETITLKQRFVIDSSSTTPISTDPILALVIFVALSSLMF
ncbi:hypothetical protein BDF21DRAFT_411802 [Thamnidium elegans]|uniref:Uncharacterized protein n=1 Tax=Thamnidium elegans TaxID=101142 RepID=A0A8H7SKB5_9FUNG|nr:hypothetical protein INT48_003653 [Thamnidium elegans]KAI8090677.1 hypothetical protein BDF21DRAFT_411802 [Thamnidium elegans]